MLVTICLLVVWALVFISWVHKVSQLMAEIKRLKIENATRPKTAVYSDDVYLRFGSYVIVNINIIANSRGPVARRGILRWAKTVKGLLEEGKET